MPGANYMGGKRNAAKARAKDSTGRIQKGFFSRRRLDLLSKGIASNQRRPSSYAGGDAGELERSNIDLAHARQKTDTSPNHGISSFIPSPTRFSPCTPKSRKSRLMLMQQHSSGGSSSQRSKVIDALDTSDPISLRVTMDRILALPDLAGLSGYQTPVRVHTSSQGIKRQRLHEEREPSGEGGNKRQKKTRPKEPDNTAASEQNPLDPLSPVPSADPFDIQLAHMSSVRTPASRSANLGSWEFSLNSDIVQDLDVSYSDFEAGLHDCSNGFDDHMILPAAEHTSTHYQHSSSSSRVHSGLCGSIGQTEDHSVRSRSVLSETSDENSPVTPPGQQKHNFLSGSFGNNVTNDFAAHDDLLTVSHAPRPSVSSNNLYEHEDPWHTIGVILGLSPTSQGKSHTLAHDAVETGSASHTPKSWQDDQETTNISLSATSLSGDTPSSRLALSSRGSSSSASRRFDLQDGKLLCSNGHLSPYELAPAQQSSTFRLNLMDWKNSEKSTPRSKDPPSSSSSFSLLGHVSLRDEDNRVRVIFDTEKSVLPVRSDLLAQDANDSLVSSPPHASAPAEHLLSATLSPTGNASDMSRPASLELALAAPKSTVALAETWKDPYDRIRWGTNCADEVFPFPTGIGAEGDETYNIYHNNRTSPLPMELFTPFKLKFQEIDGTFQGPCLFGEDGAASEPDDF